MRTLLVGLGLLAVVGIATPPPANAGCFSFAIGLPGFFGIFGTPYPPAVVYAPPAPSVVYAAPPVVYAPAPVVYARPVYYSRPVYYRHDNGLHRGWYKHHHDEDED